MSTSRAQSVRILNLICTVEGSAYFRVPNIDNWMLPRLERAPFAAAADLSVGIAIGLRAEVSIGSTFRPSSVIMRA